MKMLHSQLFSLSSKLWHISYSVVRCNVVYIHILYYYLYYISFYYKRQRCSYKCWRVCSAGICRNASRSKNPTHSYSVLEALWFTRMVRVELILVYGPTFSVMQSVNKSCPSFCRHCILGAQFPLYLTSHQIFEEYDSSLFWCLFSIVVNN